MFKVPEQYRIKPSKPAGMKKADFVARVGNNGMFIIPWYADIPSSHRTGMREYYIVASDGDGWEHVSVHILDKQTSTPKTRTPKWDEMEFVKNLFWDEEDTVIQYHPAKSNYVNVHPNVLHLWRPCGGWGDKLPTPPLYMV